MAKSLLSKYHKDNWQFSKYHSAKCLLSKHSTNYQLSIRQNGYSPNVTQSNVTQSNVGCQMSLSQISIVQMSLSQMSVVQMSLSQMSVVQMSLRQMSVVQDSDKCLSAKCLLPKRLGTTCNASTQFLTNTGSIICYSYCSYNGT
jgi:hypothetical protein